jgi:hypothetical protein
LIEITYGVKAFLTSATGGIRFPLIHLPNQFVRDSVTPLLKGPKQSGDIIIRLPFIIQVSQNEYKKSVEHIPSYITCCMQRVHENSRISKKTGSPHSQHQDKDTLLRFRATTSATVLLIMILIV